MVSKSKQVSRSRSLINLASVAASHDRSPLPVAAVSGIDHIVLHVNPAFCRLVGKKREELIGYLLPGDKIATPTDG